jgi:hypothetical protein
MKSLTLNCLRDFNAGSMHNRIVAARKLNWLGPQPTPLADRPIQVHNFLCLGFVSYQLIYT